MTEKKMLQQELESCARLKLNYLFRLDPASRAMIEFLEQKETQFKGHLAVIEALEIINRVTVRQRISRFFKRIANILFNDPIR